jgi:hypothetical protein
MMIRKIKSDAVFAEQVMFDELLFRGEGKVHFSQSLLIELMG